MKTENKIILSIKPKFVEKIFSGEKKYEFRRSIPKDKNIDTIIIYSSSPVQKIVGEIKFKRILRDKIEKIWELTKNYSGIDESDFFSYYKGKEEGYAFVIDKVLKYKENKKLDDFGIKRAPQSFIYFKGNKKNQL